MQTCIKALAPPFTPSPCKGEGWDGGCSGLVCCCRVTPSPTLPLAGGGSKAC
jgi:hypothetical protein